MWWVHTCIYYEICVFLLQGIFPMQESNLGLPHCRWILYLLNHQEQASRTLEWVAIPFSTGSFQPRDRTWVSCIAAESFLGSKITADGNCSHEIKRHLLLRRKAKTNLDGMLKCKDITLPTKFCIVKPVVFPVVLYRCESRTIKKAKSQRTDSFELWCWRRLLRVPWTAWRSNQSIL